MALDDYIEVPDRIVAFRRDYPHGWLQGSWEVVEIGDQTLIVYTAKAYRYPGAMPGIGTASEPFPGLTNFTRNAELMNAETSAWGRALAAIGYVSKDIATAEEREARGDDRKERTKVTAKKKGGEKTAATATAPQKSKLHAVAGEGKLTARQYADALKAALNDDTKIDAGEEAATNYVNRTVDRLPKASYDDALKAVEAAVKSKGERAQEAQGELEGQSA